MKFILTDTASEYSFEVKPKNASFALRDKLFSMMQDYFAKLEELANKEAELKKLQDDVKSDADLIRLQREILSHSHEVQKVQFLHNIETVKSCFTCDKSDNDFFNSDANGEFWFSQNEERVSEMAIFFREQFGFTR